MNIGVFLGALGGASVEFFETAAIAYAIARSGYWREAGLGTATGLVIVGVAATVLGTELQRIPLYLLQIAIGLVLLWFGWGWTKKSVLRQAKRKRAGWITDPLQSEGIRLETQQQGFSQLNFLVMVKSAALEALEVAIIITTLGLASRAWTEALSGAGLALILTIAVVAVLHGHLLKVPEVLIKLSAGVLLLSFGTFWLGEGLGLIWPFGDLSLIGLVGLYSFTCAVSIRWLRTTSI